MELFVGDPRGQATMHLSARCSAALNKYRATAASRLTTAVAHMEYMYGDLINAHAVLAAYGENLPRRHSERKPLCSVVLPVGISE